MITVVSLAERARWLLIISVLGVTWGAVDSVVNHVPEFLGEMALARADRSSAAQVAEFASLIMDAGWAWAAVAVLSGWLVSGGLDSGWAALCGAVAGVLVLIFATAAYYGSDVILDGDSWWGLATRYWLIGSLLFGPGLGVVGALARRSDWLGVFAGLVVPAGAALQMVLLPPAPESLMAQPVRVTIWIAAAVTAVVVLHCKRPSSHHPGGDNAEAVAFDHSSK